MSTSAAEKRRAFRTLHEQGCFVLPNAWDVGCARMLQHLGFSALASTSAGFAWATGRADNGVTLTDVLAHLKSLCDSVDIPVNADFESGFATAPDRVADHVALAVQTGVAGLSIEDRALEPPFGLFEKQFAVERIRAARAAIDETGENVVLVARTEGLLADPTAMKPAIEKLVAFAEAGADCLFAPGVREKTDMVELVRAVAPKPLNVLAMTTDVSLAEYAELGVRRVSIGGSLARVAWRAMLSAAEQLKAGSFAGLADGAPSKQLNGVFGSFV